MGNKSIGEYRLGLDIGTNSIGWALFQLNPDGSPYKLARVGVRIFSDGRNPKDGSSLAQQRRGPRQQRRRRDRYLQRRTALMNALVRLGLMPTAESARKALQILDPYALRHQGLSARIELHEFGRVIFHLNQRRGFKSNRKTDAGDDQERGKIKSAVAATKALLGNSTVGELLWQRHARGEPVRVRLKGQGVKAFYELYVERAMIEAEFAALWAQQAQHYPEVLTDAAQQALRAIIFHQRPLKPVNPGKCMLEPSEPRAPLALPSAQRFRLLQELNHLRVIEKATGEERALTRNERDQLFRRLDQRGKDGFENIRKQLFGGNKDHFEISLERHRKELLGNDTSDKLGKAKAFGARWHDIPEAEQDAIVRRLLDDPDEDSVIQWLVTDYQLTPQAAAVVSNTRLSDDYLRLSERAIAKVLPKLRDAWDDERGQALTYDKAVLAAGYTDHRAKDGDGSMAELPYYGQLLQRYTADAPTAKNADEKRFGKIANPTVHIGLNQLRKLINALIETYGKPAQIHIELARELKLSKKQKDKLRLEQRDNEARNAQLAAELAELGQTNNAENRLRLKLFHELRDGASTVCVYTGKQISLSRLFTNDYQIDHILPFAKTLDDSFNNKLLVHRSANQYKKNRTPFEAFGHSPADWPVGWDEIYGLALNLPRDKAKRFKEDALSVWLDGKEFEARQLTDTAYLARVAREYLSAICPPNRIVSTPGRLTALLRGKWGLSRLISEDAEKNRNDHRHHAIDAVVVGATDRRVLQEVSRAAGRARELDLDNLFGEFPVPWPSFRREVDTCIARCVVSHKPDHGAEGALHNDTAYGIEDGPREDGSYIVRHRTGIDTLKKNDLPKLRCDASLRAAIEHALTGDDPKQHTAALAALAERTRHAKVWLVEPMSVIPIRSRKDPLAPPYKAYKGDSNYCYELYVNERGKWDGEIISTFQANQKHYRGFMADTARYRRQARNGKPLIMRLMQNDLIAIEETEGQRRIMRVAKMSEGMIALAEHHEANVDARNRDKASGFKYMYKSPGALAGVRARRVFVDVLGRVLDPGFKG